MADNPYRRLTRARRRQSGFIALTYSRSSLWLGQDHLLEIDTSGYTETYKRFYFQDIQSVSIGLTRRRLVWNWLLGVPTAVCLAGWGYDLLFSHSFDLAGIIIGVTLTLLFGVPLLVNNLRGPTCVCHLRTAVQTEDLPSLSRLPQTRRVLDRLRPLIAQAQGQLAPEEIPARMQAWTAAAAAAHVEPTAAKGEWAGEAPSSAAAGSAAPTAQEGSEASPPAEVAAPEDGRTPAAGPNPGPAEAKVRYVVDDPNVPPRIIS